MTFVGLAVAGVLAAVFSFSMAFQRTLYGAAVCLLVVLLQVAALYFLLGAQVLAMIQVMVYAGAVMVLIVTAVMTASSRNAVSPWSPHRSRWFLGGAILAPVLGMGAYFFRVVSIGGGVSNAASFVERGAAQLLFGPYALMTEAAGLVILLSALALVVEEKES